MRQVRVKILTANNLQISGELTTTLSPDRVSSKLSELLNSSRNFITLTDVEVRSHDRQLLVQIPYLYINKPAISLVFEEEFTQASTGTPKTHNLIS